MRWTKLKKQLESLLAPSVAGRVELRSTRYRSNANEEGRGTLVLDGKEVLNCCTLLYQQRRSQLGDSSDEAPLREQLHAEGVYSQYDFYDALELYSSIGIDEALASGNLVVRALSLLDRRLGKRRLQALDMETLPYPVLREVLEFRLLAEGLALP